MGRILLVGVGSYIEHARHTNSYHGPCTAKKMQSMAFIDEAQSIFVYRTVLTRRPRRVDAAVHEKADWKRVGVLQYAAQLGPTPH